MNQGTSVRCIRAAALALSYALLAPAAAGGDSVNRERAVHAEAEPGQWMLHGRTYDEQRFSPLTDINDDNVGGLGVAWYADIASPDGLVSTPIVVDGVVYLSGSLARVFALDAGTGRMLWEFDPEIRLDMGFSNSWSARINRGVAVWKGKVFVGAGDCRLIAIDAGTGGKVWETLTCDPLDGYGITGAPRAFNDKIVIGNLGGDTATRGYITAYDTETGKQVWRFYTTPGNPADGFENEAMAMAAKTWSGEGWWEGSGGNAWDAIVYDPEFNQVYLGTDSAEPKDPSVRSPGGGDNLFTNAIVAIDADTGAYRWHYQTVPRDAWDYNATNHIVLADLEIDGENRKVLMQAPKNGFFYVLDRRTGELLRVGKYAKVTWAEGIDRETGRPVVAEIARYYDNAEGRSHIYPHPIGGHSWQPMSFSPHTGLVYIPAHDFPATYDRNVKYLEWSNYEIDPANARALKGVGHLLAWDPIKQAPGWNVEHDLPINSGILSTAGNLVFQGTGEGDLNAYAADDGRLLWSHPTGSSVQSGPVSYRWQGEQYILSPVGVGGQARLMFPLYGTSPDSQERSRLVAFKLGGTEKLPDAGASPASVPVPEPPDIPMSAELVARGEKLYASAACMGCHGLQVVGTPGSSAPDLRYLTAEKHQRWHAVVLGGALAQKGMSGHASYLTREDSEALHAYVVDKQRQLYVRQQRREKHD